MNHLYCRFLLCLYKKIYLVQIETVDYSDNVHANTTICNRNMRVAYLERNVPGR